MTYPITDKDKQIQFTVDCLEKRMVSPVAFMYALEKIAHPEVEYDEQYRQCYEKRKYE